MRAYTAILVKLEAATAKRKKRGEDASDKTSETARMVNVQVVHENEERKNRHHVKTRRMSHSAASTFDT